MTGKLQLSQENIAILTTAGSRDNKGLTANPGLCGDSGTIICKTNPHTFLGTC